MKFIQIKSESVKVKRWKGEEWDYETMLWNEKEDSHLSYLERSNLPILKKTKEESIFKH